MIVPDVNLLLYANDASSPRHAESLAWWESSMNGNEEVGLPWVVAMGFVRMATSGRIFEKPLAVREATDKITRWYGHPRVNMIAPGSRHIEIWIRLLVTAGSGGNLTTGAHLAALAIEHGAVLYSTDLGFKRFEGLRWTNPLPST